MKMPKGNRKTGEGSGKRTTKTGEGSGRRKTNMPKGSRRTGEGSGKRTMKSANGKRNKRRKKRQSRTKKGHPCVWSIVDDICKQLLSDENAIRAVLSMFEVDVPVDLHVSGIK